MLKIYIHGYSLVTEHGDWNETWQAWQTGTGPRQTFPTYASLRTRILQDFSNALNRHTPPAQSPLILATTKGDIDAQVAWMRAVDSGSPPGDPPTLATEGRRCADQLAIGGGGRGVHVISTACTSGLTALMDASLLLLDNEAPEVAILAIDAITDFVQQGFQSLKGISPTLCRPFDAHRDGLSLGSGAAAALLSSTRPSPIAITGIGIASDAVHMTAPDREARGLIRAIRSALASANLQPSDIHAILAHGTATRYNDAMEALAIAQVFPHKPPITAVKGLIGHTLGASGLVEAMLAMRMLETQSVPPVTNLTTPEYEALSLTRECTNTRLRHVMKIAAGFGGVNAAVILSLTGEPA